MKPSEQYQKLQKKLLRLVDVNGLTGERPKIQKQLEKEFMAAWQLSPDRLRLGCKLAKAIQIFRTKDGSCVRGFDHCTYYTGANDQRIIVTQPYGVSQSEIAGDLILDGGVCAEVIDATEWAFYYPGQAKLFIVRFPRGFQKAMQDFEKACRKAEIQSAIKCV